MSRIKISITAFAVRTLDKAHWQDEWDEARAEAGEDELEEGGYGEPSDEFVLERYQTDLEEGNLDLSEELETASIEVKQID